MDIIGLKFDPERPNPLAEAISLYPSLVYDKKVMNNIKKKVYEERKKARISKFYVEGTYTYAMPDMYAFCEYLFMGNKNPHGLVPKKQVYCKVFDDREDIKNVCVLRSPHLSGYEFAKRRLVKSNECKQWFVGYDTVVSIHDLITKTLQMDVDGDELLITPQKEIWELAEDKPPLFYEMAKAGPIQITDDAIFDTLKKAFENCLVGFISNGESRLWNVKSKDEIDDDLICIETAYNNYSIDYPKTGINLNLEKYPEIWDKHLKYIGDFADFDNKIEPTVKKPYFFIGKENKKKSDITECEKYYDSYNDSIMNRIFEQIDEDVVRAYSYSDADGVFDYHMLMNNELNADGKPKYEVNTNAKYYYELMKALVELKKVEKTLSQKYATASLNDKTDREERDNEFILFYYECVKRIKEVFTTRYYNENLAVNTIIHIMYNQEDLLNYFPDVLWECYGQVVVSNIANNLKSGYVPVSTKRKAYKQALIGDAVSDHKIDELLHKEPLVITQNEFEQIHSMTKDNKATVQARITFSLLCMYKAMVKNSNRKPEDIWLRIYMNKQQKTKRGRKKKGNEKKICHNFSEIDKLSYVSNGESKIKMSVMEDNAFYKIRHEPYKYYEIQFKQDNSDESFKVPDYKNAVPELYDFAGYTDKVVRICPECGKKFFVKDKKDRTVACDGLCRSLRTQKQKAKSYKQSRQTLN